MNADLRLAVPAVCGWMAAAIAIGVPEIAVPALVVAWLAAAALTFVRPSLALCVAAIALCCTSIAVHAPQRQIDADGVVSIVATTTQTVTPGRDTFEVRVDAVDGTPASLPALVFGATPDQRIGIGSVIEIESGLEAAEPGDDRAYLLFPDTPATVISGPPWYLSWADGLRESFLAVADSLPGEGGDLLAGLAIGDTTAVSDELDRAMKTSSLSHLTAVSGANCAIVIGLVMLAGGVLGWARWARVAASVLVLLGFVVLVTPEPSVLRAAVMATIVLVAMARDRPVRGVPVLALATLVLLVIDPWLARNYGFVLSVLATAGLLLLAGPLGDALGRWLPRWLALTIAVPVAAQLACQPVILLLDASLPTYGVVANILAAPAAPVATVIGLAACVALALVPPLGVLLASVAWLPSAWIAAVAQFFAQAPLARLEWPPGILGVGLLVALSVLAVLALRRRWAAFALAIAIVAYLGIAAGGHLAGQLGRPSDWQVAGCDVGQGDAFVIRSADRVALIDTGPDPEPLRTCLADLGIDSIDLLVLTHYDTDHVGGVDAVVGRVETAIVGPSGGDAEAVRELLAAGGATVTEVARGVTGALGELRWRVLWPPPRLAGIEPGNDASVVLAVDGVGACIDGCLSGVYLGDLGESAQSRLLAATPVQPVDVVKVSHHGSADQSAEVYERLAATVGVIGVGAENGYGHPTESLLDLLASVGTAAVRTDDSGLILLAPGDEPGSVSVWTER